jgi:hypothetical protein
LHILKKSQLSKKKNNTPTQGIFLIVIRFLHNPFTALWINGMSVMAIAVLPREGKNLNNGELWYLI